MSSLCLLADVHISPLTVSTLNSQGYNIVRTTDLLPATATDAEILELARVEGKTVLTQAMILYAFVNFQFDEVMSNTVWRSRYPFLMIVRGHGKRIGGDAPLPIARVN